MPLHGLTGKLISGQFGKVRNSDSFENKTGRDRMKRKLLAHGYCAKITSAIVKSWFLPGFKHKLHCSLLHSRNTCCKYSHFGVIVYIRVLQTA